MFLLGSTYEELGVDLEFICHSLNVNPKVIQRKQQPQWSSKEHAEAMKEEVQKLEQVGAIKKVSYLEWLANTVVVKKKSGNGEYVWILQILTRLALKSHSLSRGLTSVFMQHLTILE